MVKWTPKAEDDLDILREYISKNFSVELAIKVANELIDYLTELKQSNLRNNIRYKKTRKWCRREDLNLHWPKPTST